MRLPSASMHTAEEVQYWPWGLPFEMVRTADAALVWSNRRLPYGGGETALLEEFAWHIPPSEAGHEPTGLRKTFYAECYGGDGIHHNGGGVRCGWRHPWLVKGIGINLLSGYSDEDAASYRNNGRACLSEILVEAVWGEVLQYALPFGAARMTAVISTGQFAVNGTPTSAGIGVREFVWRPAHFMRAPGFHVRPENKPFIPSDTSRVKEAILRLPEVLPMPTISAFVFGQLTPMQRLTLGLKEMVRRFAEQMAAAKAKRLSHGTLSTSNISLDGRWNDLNSVSALPSYGFRRNMAPFWSDQVSLFKSINLLCYYIRKYFPTFEQNQRASPGAAWLSAIYKKLYEDALSRRFVGLCGYPHNVSGKVWMTVPGQQSMRVLADTLIAMAKSGQSPRRPYEDEMDASIRGEYALTKILKTISRVESSDDADLHLADLIPVRATRQKFIQQYMTVKYLMREEAIKQEVNQHSFARLVAFNCAKSDRNIPSLYRNVLFRRCDDVAHPGQSDRPLCDRVAELIEPLVDEARVIYQEARDYKTLLWCDRSATVIYDACAESVIIDFCDTPDTPVLSGSATRSEASVMQSMKAYWGGEFEEIMR